MTQSIFSSRQVRNRVIVLLPRNAATVACLFSKKVMFLLKTILLYDPVDDKPLLSGRPRNGGLTVVHNAGAALIDYFVDWYLN